MSYVYAILLIGAYWTPSIVAAVRKPPNIGSIIVCNFFAFTVVCWIIALVMACKDTPKPIVVTMQQPSQPLPPGPQR